MNFPRLLIVSLAISTVVFQSGCATRSAPAPVVDRSGGKGASIEPVQPGFYRIKRGDTLLRIALDHGQSHRDIAEWNNIADMNQIEVDFDMLKDSTMVQGDIAVLFEKVQKLEITMQIFPL